MILDRPGRMRPAAVAVRAATGFNAEWRGFYGGVHPDVNDVEVRVLTNRLTQGFAGCWS